MSASKGGVFERLYNSLLSTNLEDWPIKLLAIVIAILLSKGAKKFWKWVRPRAVYIFTCSHNLIKAKDAVSVNGKGIWIASSFPPAPPKNYATDIRRSIPIITVANLKGGVGKTTTALNLAAHYAIKKNQRTLLIDLDFQGSLSVAALSAEDYAQMLIEQADGAPGKAARLIDKWDAEQLNLSHEPVNGVKNLRIIPAFYSLASAENRVMVEWLIGERQGDVRYQLATLLLSPLIQQSFKRIIIDAPPRLTTGCVQALCASTHVLIPTILDKLSAEAVGSFVDQIKIHQTIWPELKICGVLANMTDISTVEDQAEREQPLSDYEVDAKRLIEDVLVDGLAGAEKPLRTASIMPTTCFIPDKTELGRAAGHRIAYASSSNVGAALTIKQAFDRLGDEIDRRIALRA